jgi:hypothetical protein
MMTTEIRKRALELAVAVRGASDGYTVEPFAATLTRAKAFSDFIESGTVPVEGQDDDE